MTSPAPSVEELAREVKSLSRAVRIGFLLLTLIFAYFAFRQAFSVGSFSLIFRDMLGGKPLPAITNLAIHGRPVWIATSVLFPLAAVVFAFVPKRPAIGVIGICTIALLLAAQSVFLWAALTSPLFAIINSMRAG